MKRVIGGSMALALAIGFLSASAFAQCGQPSCGVTTTCGQPSCPSFRLPKLNKCNNPVTCSTCAGQDLGVQCNKGVICGSNACKSDCGVRLPKCLDLGGPNVKVRNGKVYAWQGFPSSCATPGDAAVVIEKLAPATVCLEDPITYEIQISNRGKTVLANVQIVDTLPANFVFESASNGAQPNSDGQLAFNVGDLAANSAQCFTITGRATSVGCLVFAGEAQATFRFPIALPMTVIQCALDVAVTAPECVDLCDCFDILVCVKNPGTAVSVNNCVTVNLPAGITGPKGETSFQYAIASLRPGEAKTYNIKGLKASATGTYGITAVAVNGKGLTAAGNATVKIRQPQLVITKAATERVFLGKKVVYQITVTNAGDCPAKDVVVCDAFASDSAAVKIGTIAPKPNMTKNSSALTWNFGTLQPSETKTINYEVTALEMGYVKNTAVATAYCAAPCNADASTLVEGKAGIVVCVSDDVDPVEVGTNVTYTIDAKNQGMIANTNVAVRATLDEGMEFVGAQGPKDVKYEIVDNKTVVFTPLSSLGIRQIAQWKITVKATAEGDKRLRTTLKTDQFVNEPVVNEESTTFYDPKIVVTSSAK